MSNTRSITSSPSATFVNRGRYLLGLLAVKLKRLREGYDFSPLEETIAIYEAATVKYLGREIADCKVVEIGYGQRPNALSWLASAGVPITGIDIERPLMSGSLAELLGVARRNGVLRALKSAVAYHLFDKIERVQLAKAFEKATHKPFVFPRDRLKIADATTGEFWSVHPEEFDFVYSFEAFQHIPGEKIASLLEHVHRALKPGGIVHIRVDVYTGITGGLLPEWYPNTLKTPRDRESEPWEHLRKGRFEADAYLNRLGLKDYRRLFSKNFSIVEEERIDFGLGRDFLTPEVRADLADYDEADLVTNQVNWILQK